MFYIVMHILLLKLFQMIPRLLVLTKSLAVIKISALRALFCELFRENCQNYLPWEEQYKRNHHDYS